MRSADLAASENLRSRRYGFKMKLCPPHKTVVYSTLLEVGSMAEIIEARLSPPELGCFRIIGHLLCQPPWTSLSPPRASNCFSGGRTPTSGHSNRRPPDTLRGAFGSNCGELRRTGSRLLPN